MRPPNAKLEWQRALTTLSGVTVLTVIVAALFWARSILIPVALAIFLTFVLSPVVAWLQRRRLSRLPAVLATVGLAVATVLLIGWVVTSQLSKLSRQLPDHADRLKEKVISARALITGDGESRLGQLITDLSTIISQSPTAPDSAKPSILLQPEVAVPPTPAAGAVGGAAAAGGTTTVAASRTPVIAPAVPPPPTGPPSWLDQLGTYASPAVEVLGQAAFAFVLTVFMLLKKEDLRNRLIRLTGTVQVTTTTKAVDDASRRISRYLFTQLLINSGFAVIITVVLLIIGVPYAMLWGFLAWVMRYVPYIGTWLGLLPPVIVSLAMSEGWWQPLTVIAVYAGLELLCNNVFEPWLYGSSMGLSEVAQLVAAAFWAFLWGPIGLVLSGPLTVCLLVLGKYVPRLEFFQVLLGDEPALTPDVRLYQRLAARDQDEATEVAREALRTSSAEQAFDQVLIPALTYAKRDYDQNVLGDEDLPIILQSMREIIDELIDRQLMPPTSPPDADMPRARVLAIPAKDEADEVALSMLQGLLDPARWEVEVSPVERLTSEVVAVAGAVQPSVIVIGALPPGGLAHTRYLCKRIARQFPETRLLIGRWGLSSEVEENRRQLLEAGAVQVHTSLGEMIQHLTGWSAALTANQQRVVAGNGDGKSAAVPAVGMSSA